MIPPIYYIWDGHAMVPMDRFARLAEQSFINGRAYRLMVDEERSSASHRQYFAAVREAFLNLPEEWADRFATPDHLRKWCLIKAGFRNERSVVCSSRAEAIRMAAFIREIDDYAVVLASGAAVIHYTAKSQSMHAMGKAEFQRSKEAVLDLLAKIIEVTPDQLSEAARAA